MHWLVTGSDTKDYYQQPWPILDVGDYVLYFFLSLWDVTHDSYREDSWTLPAVASDMFTQHAKKDKETVEKIKAILTLYPQASVRRCRNNSYTSPHVMSLITPHTIDVGGSCYDALVSKVTQFIKEHGYASFILDSGAGRDLVSIDSQSRLNDMKRVIDYYINFRTCNGMISSNAVLDLLIKCLGTGVSAHVLKSTPSILSMGKRCMLEGYTYIWVQGKTPVVMLPDWTGAVLLTVSGVMPYLENNAQVVAMPCGDEISE